MFSQSDALTFGAGTTITMGRTNCLSFARSFTLSSCVLPINLSFNFLPNVFFPSAFPLVSVRPVPESRCEFKLPALGAAEEAEACV